MPRPSTPRISRDAAVRASIEIIDAEGLEAFSLPRLARHLGVQAPSLYHHFADKNEIFVEVARFIGGSSVATPRRHAGDDWPEFFVALALNFRRSILKHRNAAPILLQYLPRSLFIETYEDTAHFLKDPGIPSDLHVRILDGLETLSIGAVLIEAMRPATTKSTIFPNVDPESQQLLAQALAENEYTQRMLYVELVRSFLHGVVRERCPG